MLARHTLIIFSSLLAATALTGCGHSVSRPLTTSSTGLPPTSSSGEHTTLPGGINVTYSSNTPMDGLVITAEEKEAAKLTDGFVATAGEKEAAKFISNVGYGNLAAANAEMKGHQGDPIGQIATQVKAHGAITDITFTDFNPKQEMQDLYCTITFADKKTSTCQIEEEADSSDNWPSIMKAPDPKRAQAIYASGKWNIFAIF